MKYRNSAAAKLIIGNYDCLSADNKRCSAPFKSVCPFLLFRPKEMDVIRALIHPWALGLAYIRVRLENGAAARSLSRQNYRAFLRNVCDSLRLLTRRFFANFLFACEAPRWRLSYRLSISLRLIVQVLFLFIQLFLSHSFPCFQ